MFTAPLGGRVEAREAGPGASDEQMSFWTLGSSSLIPETAKKENFGEQCPYVWEGRVLPFLHLLPLKAAKREGSVPIQLIRHPFAELPLHSQQSGGERTQSPWVA